MQIEKYISVAFKRQDLKTYAPMPFSTEYNKEEDLLKFLEVQLLIKRDVVVTLDTFLLSPKDIPVAFYGYPNVVRKDLIKVPPLKLHAIVVSFDKEKKEVEFFSKSINYPLFSIDLTMFEKFVTEMKKELGFA